MLMLVQVYVNQHKTGHLYFPLVLLSDVHPGAAQMFITIHASMSNKKDNIDVKDVKNTMK